MSSFEIQKFSGAYVFPGSILIDATGQNVGAIISEPKKNCFVIRTKDLETFAYAHQVAMLLYYSQMLPPRCGCSKLTKNVPTIELDKYKELYFALCKSHSKEDIKAAFDCVEDIEVKIRERQDEIKELRQWIKTIAYELFC